MDKKVFAQVIMLKSQILIFILKIGRKSKVDVYAIFM